MQSDNFCIKKAIKKKIGILYWDNTWGPNNPLYYSLGQQGQNFRTILYSKTSILQGWILRKKNILFGGLVWWKTLESNQKYIL